LTVSSNKADKHYDAQEIGLNTYAAGIDYLTRQDQVNIWVCGLYSLCT